jgi:hypothetical protein
MRRMGLGPLKLNEFWSPMPKLNLIWITAIFLLNQHLSAQTAFDYDSKTPSATTENTALALQIKELEEAQAASWNRHDVRGYLSFFLDSPKFVSMVNKSTIMGYQTFRDHILQKYEGKKNDGHLDIDRLQILILNDTTAMAFLYYRLSAEGDRYYCDDTELIMRTKTDWKIAVERANIH